jgi:hypothetical protein
MKKNKIFKERLIEDPKTESHRAHVTKDVHCKKEEKNEGRWTTVCTHNLSI